MTDHYILRFYFAEVGDLGVPDVYWSGGIFSARSWARSRLEYLGADNRPSHQFGPLQCSIWTASGQEICVAELTSAPGQVAGRWHAPGHSSNRPDDPEQAEQGELLG
nr:hypothetical protein [uncultured Roseococcus sp.]